MPCINIPIEPLGPTIDVGIAAPSSLAMDDDEVPPPTITWFKAIVDTGCSRTSIHSSVAAECGLQVMGKGTVATTAPQVAVNVYHGDLFLRCFIGWETSFELKFPDRGLVEMLHKNPAFDILLGMNILNRGVFSANGGLRQATFAW
jgi:hypothetical protein